MGNDTKLEPAEAKKLRHALDTEMTKVKSTRLDPLSSINTVAFGCSSPGQELWTQVDDAGTHVNATLDNLEKALKNYHDAFENAANGIEETQEQLTADAKNLTTGLGLVNKPFYETKKSTRGTKDTTDTTNTSDVTTTSFTATLGGGPRALEV